METECKFFCSRCVSNALIERIWWNYLL